jgi:hypothetical protein
MNRVHGEQKALIYTRWLFMPSEILAPIYFGVELAAKASEAIVLVSEGTLFSIMVNTIVFKIKSVH